MSRANPTRLSTINEKEKDVKIYYVYSTIKIKDTETPGCQSTKPSKIKSAYS